MRERGGKSGREKGNSGIISHDVMVPIVIDDDDDDDDDHDITPRTIRWHHRCAILSTPHGWMNVSAARVGPVVKPV